MYTFIGGTNRTDKIIKDSVVITDELQERVNTAEFRMYGLKPTELDDVKIFEAFPIYSFTRDSITLDKKYAQAILNNLFRTGDTIYLNAPNDTSAVVSSISRDFRSYISNLVAFYDGSGTDQTGNGNSASSTGGAVSYGSDKYGNYIYFQGDKNFTAGTGTAATVGIGNRMNYTHLTDYSWSCTVSVLSLPPNNGAGIFGSGFDNSVYISNTNGAMSISLRGTGTNLFIGIGSNYWLTRLGEIHTIGFTYIASEAKAYGYLDGVLQNTGGSAGPTTFLCNEWGIGDNAIGGGNGSSCHKKVYQTKVFGKALTASEHLKLHQEGTALASANDERIKLSFASAFTTLPTVGNIAGKKKFAGNIIEITDSNEEVLTNVEFGVTCLDYTRIFDKKNINDTYEDVSARYIINDFCNVTVNPNQELDPFSYTNDAAIQAAWTESGDGGNPTIDTSNYREGTRAGVFPWTFSGGTATFTDAITAVNLSPFTGVSSGTPTKGRIGFWYKATDYTKITTFVVRVGSDSSNYIQSPAIDPTSNEWVFYDFPMATATKVGTPVWTAVDYIAIVVTETASSSITIDGIRGLENDFFRHYPYVQDSITLDEFRINRVKPTEVMQRLADTLSWYWYVDYNRYIHLFAQTTTPAPISLTPTSNNFANLSIEADTSRLVNRQVVRASDETSTSDYSQVIQGDGVTREWLMKTSFANLTVKLNDGTSTDTMEATTTTTTVKATAHGLSVGDYIVNRTRSNAVREVLTVPDANTFTVAAVTSQASGDTFSLFVSQTVGVEGIDVEASYDYMSNFTEKSIRASSAEGTLVSGQFLLFTYNEVIPILVQRTDNVSVANIKNLLGYGDGIFDGQPITDKSIKTRFEAMALADATVNKYSNTIITARFTTEQEGLEAGQIISIQDTGVSQRSINQSFVIQSVRMRQLAWGENRYTVVCSSLLFGMVELLQQMLSANRKVAVDENEVINNIEDANETLTITDSTSSSNDGQISTETLTISDSVTSDEVVPPFLWGDTGGGATEFQWQLSAWG